MKIDEISLFTTPQEHWGEQRRKQKELTQKYVIKKIKNT
jgi:hypothetical protein